MRQGGEGRKKEPLRHGRTYHEPEEASFVRRVEWSHHEGVNHRYEVLIPQGEDEGEWVFLHACVHGVVRLGMGEFVSR